MPSQSVKEFTERLLSELQFANRQEVEKPWGREVIFTTKSFILKFIDIWPEGQTSLQVHEVKDEVTLPIWVGYGGGRVEADQLYEPMASAEDYTFQHEGHPLPIRTRPGTVHRTIGPITLMEVTTLENEDIIRIKDDFGR